MLIDPFASWSTLEYVVDLIRLDQERTMIRQFAMVVMTEHTLLIQSTIFLLVRGSGFIEVCLSFPLDR